MHFGKLCDTDGWAFECSELYAEIVWFLFCPRRAEVCCIP